MSDFMAGTSILKLCRHTQNTHTVHTFIKQASTCTLAKQSGTHTHTHTGWQSRHRLLPFSVAYKYNLLLVLKILSYTLYKNLTDETQAGAVMPWGERAEELSSPHTISTMTHQNYRMQHLALWRMYIYKGCKVCIDSFRKIGTTSRRTHKKIIVIILKWKKWRLIRTTTSAVAL